MLTVAGSSVARTVAVPSSDTTTAPSVIATVPRTFAMPAWRTVKEASECEGSIVQVPAVSAVVVVVVLMRVAPYD